MYLGVFGGRWILLAWKNENRSSGRESTFSLHFLAQTMRVVDVVLLMQSFKSSSQLVYILVVDLVDLPWRDHQHFLQFTSLIHEQELS